MRRCEAESVWVSSVLHIYIYIYVHLHIYISIPISLSKYIDTPKIYLEWVSAAGARRCEAESVRLSSAFHIYIYLSIHLYISISKYIHT